MANQPRASLGQPIEVDDFRHASVGDTYRTVGSPSGFEAEQLIFLRLLHSDMVVDVYEHAVTGERPSIAAVISPHHVDATVVRVEHGTSVFAHTPRRVAKSDAFALRSRRAYEFKCCRIGGLQHAGSVGSTGQGKSQPPAVRIG